MTNGYFDSYAPLPRHQNARAEAVNAIFDAVKVGFDGVPAAAAIQQDRVTHCIDTGAADAYVIAPTTAILSYVAGQHFTFVAVHANTMASTVNVSTLGVKTIKRQDGTDLSAGDIAAGQVVDIRYDGTNFQLMSVPSGTVAAAAASAAAAVVSASAASSSAGAASTSASAASASATAAAASVVAAAGTVSQWAVAAGTADAITATFPVTVTSLTDGLILGFRASAANATTTPTFKADGTTAHTITKKGGAALLAGDIPGALAECMVRYNLANTRWELQNPAPRVAFSDSDFRIQDNGNATKQVAFEVSGISTGTTRTITVPDASITLARIDGAQTLAGTQSFSGSILTDTLTNYTSGNRVVVQAVGVAAGAVIMDFRGSDTGFTASICDMDAGGANNAGTAFQIQKVNSTGRSISAAGTINASGADYAEYETKADGCGAVAKGQIVGFDADGKLTDKFSAAISFGIKSTDPSYVGGDVWGSEDAIGMGKPKHPGGAPKQDEGEADDAFAGREQAHAAALSDFDTKMELLNAALEVARARVDRVAYCGKVPVNVTGARPGDYIVAAVGDKDSITGQIVGGTPTFGQYLKAVGRVRRILPDGRATVAVIVQ